MLELILQCKVDTLLQVPDFFPHIFNPEDVIMFGSCNGKSQSQSSNQSYSFTDLPATFNYVNCCCINVRALDMTVQLHKIVHKNKQNLHTHFPSHQRTLGTTYKLLNAVISKIVWLPIDKINK